MATDSGTNMCPTPTMFITTSSATAAPMPVRWRLIFQRSETTRHSTSQQAAAAMNLGRKTTEGIFASVRAQSR